MKRILISLDEEEKEWLAQAAAREGQPITELARRAVKLLRAQTAPSAQTLADLLERTRGLWPNEDGLAYQRRLRDEW
jgi:hypothetical protein